MSFILSADDLPSLQSYLLERKWIAPAEELISASKPGEGNMNYTLRVRSNFRSFIVKQAREYVEKYPQIPAPVERATMEGRFYELIQDDPYLRAYTPELSYLDEENGLLLMEDLGESSDFTFLYQAQNHLGETDLQALMEFLSILHQDFRNHISQNRLRNRAMRDLNAEHIFHYPFMEENGFDLDSVTPGLQAVAMRYKQDAVLKARVSSLSKLYLNDGESLLHGDYYPGSWLKTLEGVRVIDPEFCFFGPAEFDLSVMLAHFHMAQQTQAILDGVLTHYTAGKVDSTLLNQLTGVEIMRRLIGLAQLPLSLGLTEKEKLLEQAYKLVMG